MPQSAGTLIQMVQAETLVTKALKTLTLRQSHSKPLLHQDSVLQSSRKKMKAGLLLSLNLKAFKSSLVIPLVCQHCCQRKMLSQLCFSTVINFYHWLYPYFRSHSAKTLISCSLVQAKGNNGHLKQAAVPASCC